MHHPDLVRFLARALPSVRVGVAVTTDSVLRLRLEVGSQSVAIVKATEVIVGKG